MIQLRIRTEYTLGKTYAPIPRVIQRLKEMGVTAAGIVDQDSTWGHVQWYKACNDAGIQPLLGVDLIVSDDESTRRMWFLAKNEERLRELYDFTSLAFRQKIAVKNGSFPCLHTYDVEHMSGNVFIFAGDWSEEEFLYRSCAILDISPASRILNAKKKAMIGFQTVEVCDNSYVYASDKPIFEIIGRSALKTTPQHIIEVETGHAEKYIAIECNCLELPHAPMLHQDGDIEAMCLEGLKHRRIVDSGVYQERLRYELDLIKSKNFESYFLIVADMVRYAKQHMLVGPSRGSAAGSLVCYLLGITEIDPIPAKLYFERFIDVNRSDLPDIDLDFPDNKRHIVFEYMAQKYGAQNVAHIGTIGTFKPKSALIHASKALRIPAAATAATKASMITREARDERFNNCLADTLTDTEPGRQLVEMYPEIAIAGALEGHASHTGTHAAGLLVCNEPLTNFCTVDGDGIAQIDKYSAETLGLLKIDVLGIRTLGVIEDSGVKIDWYNLPLDDAAAYNVFNSGNMSGIFQFEGEATRRYTRDINIKSIEEVDAITALARPGPLNSGVAAKYVSRKKGIPYSPIHPLVEEVLKDTLGLPIYQENTLALVREIGRFNWEDTTAIRKAISKSLGAEFMAKYRDKFIAGATGKGLSVDQAFETWQMIATMGGWQMNKAHTYSYAVLSYWTAYLKAHYPLEFAAATLRNAKDEDSALGLLKEFARNGIKHVPFDIDHSQLSWSIKDGKLLGGFMTLKGVGNVKAEELIKAREEGRLTQKMREEIATYPNVFSEIAPFHGRYGDFYDNPAANGIAGKLLDIADLTEKMPHACEKVFLAELLQKDIRDANDEVQIKKRGGKRETGQTTYLNVKLRDDTDMIYGRVGRHDYLKFGKELLDNVPIGAHLLIRAKFFNGIRYAFISKWRRLDV